MRRGDLYIKIREPFFFDYVKQQLIDKFGVNTVRKGGLRVYTTIDPKLQKAGRNAIDSTLNYPGDPSSAVVAIDPRTGYIKAMASSSKYKHNQYNLAAQGHRQPGSAFKTFVLTTAIKRGVNPYSTSYVSKPLDLNTRDYGPWKVQTYDQSYGGSMNLARATLKSDNTVFAQLDLDLGPQSVADTAKEMGITTKLDGYPAEGLGGLKRGVSPLEMANAYATLASGGIRNKPIAILRVKFPDGEVEDLGKPKRERVFSDAVAYEVTKILKQNVQQGTGTRANIGCPSAGKTGTTDNFNDAWFDGYTPRLATAVWVGLPGRAQGDAQRARDLGRRRNLPGDDLEQVHAGRQGRQLQRLPAPEEHDQLVAVLRQVLQGRRRATSVGRRAVQLRGLHGRRLPGLRSASLWGAQREPSRRWRNRQRRGRRPAAAPAARSSAARGALGVLGATYVALAVLWAAPGRTSCSPRAAGRRTGCWARSSRSARRSPTAASAGRSSTRRCGSRCSRTAPCWRTRAGSGRAPSPPRSSLAHVLFAARPAAALAGRVQLHRVRAARRRARPRPVHAQPQRRARRRGVPLRRIEGLHERLRAAVHGRDLPAREARACRSRSGSLKAVAALASLAIVALVWWCARRLGRDPRLPALLVGLNPLVLVHVVGGAHNDALTVLLWMGGVAALLAGARGARRRAHRGVRRGEGCPPRCSARSC